MMGDYDDSRSCSMRTIILFFLIFNYLNTAIHQSTTALHQYKEMGDYTTMILR